MEASWFCRNAISLAEAEPCCQVETTEVLRHWEPGQVSSDQAGRSTSTRVTEGQKMQLNKGKVRFSHGQSSVSMKTQSLRRQGPSPSFAPQWPNGPAHLRESTPLLQWSSLLPSAWWDRWLRTGQKWRKCLWWRLTLRFPGNTSHLFGCTY